MTENKWGGGWITELQVMRMCAMHDDENLNREVLDIQLYTK